MRNPPLTEPVAASRRRRYPHPLFLVLLLVGITLRVLVSIAYRPVLLFPDSRGYLGRAEHLKFSPEHPGGYSLFLWPIVHVTHQLWVIAVVNHVLGVGLAVAIYALLRRRGLPGWGAALAAAPVLLDPLQLVLEQYLLSDLLFEVVVAAACIALLWRRRPGWPDVIATGLLVGCAGVIRGAGALLVVVVVVAALALRVRWMQIATMVVAALLPVAGYAGLYHHVTGQYSVAGGGSRFLWARLAPVITCTSLQVPAYERSLCPSQPVSQRPSSDWYMWGGHRSAQWHLDPPPGMTPIAVLKDFDRRVVRAEPSVFARVTAVDFARGFRPTRTEGAPGFPARHWIFHEHYWPLDHFSLHRWNKKLLAERQVDVPLARFFTHYGRWIYLPGPALVVLLVLALLAAFGAGRARWSGTRLATAVLVAGCLATLLTSAALSGASWRYQLPQLALLPPAGALAIAALSQRRRAPETIRAVSRSTALMLAVLSGVVGCAVLVASRWVRPEVAAAIGAVIVVAAAVGLLRARRALPAPDEVPAAGDVAYAAPATTAGFADAEAPHDAP